MFVAEVLTSPVVWAPVMVVSAIVLVAGLVMLGMLFAYCVVLSCRWCKRASRSACPAERRPLDAVVGAAGARAGSGAGQGSGS